MRRLLLYVLLLLPTVPGRAAPVPAPALSVPDPKRALQDFLAAYWDADQGYFLAWNRGGPFVRPSGAGPQGGKYADFWWEAQLWDLVLDAAERDPQNTGLRALVGAVYEGFERSFPDWNNDFNDDLGWWAQAAMRAYRLTGEARYLTQAQTLFGSIWAYWTPDAGGGVLWRRSGSSQKNVATNGPLAVTAVRLYQATKNDTYLTRARQLYAFVDAQLTDGDARVYDNREGSELRRWDFTYNVGNFVLAALALREVTAEPDERGVLLMRAVRSTDWALANLTNAGILLDEGVGDGGGFKGVFLRGMHTLWQVPELDATRRERYAQSLRDQATGVWNARRPADGLVGADWAAPQPGGIIESLAAASAVAALQLAPSPLMARAVLGDGRYEAENSAREGVNSSVTAAGFSGRGYVNAFFRDGQYVEFRVNVPAAGTYPIRLRYSAGGGVATRSLALKGAAQDGAARPLTFPATPDWATWTELETPLELVAGSNLIRVAFDRRAGSRNWLNLDRLTIGNQP